MAIRIRKLLVSAIYDKVGNLSMKAMASTNSGKLVTLVSADIFMLERGLAFAPIIFSTPLSNLTVIIALGFTTSWINSGIVLGVWIIMILLQF